MNKSIHQGTKSAEHFYNFLFPSDFCFKLSDGVLWLHLRSLRCPKVSLRAYSKDCRRSTRDQLMTRQILLECPRDVFSEKGHFHLFPPSCERSGQTPNDCCVGRLQKNAEPPIAPHSPTAHPTCPSTFNYFHIFKLSLACYIVHAVPDAIKGVPAEHFVCGHAQLPSLNSPQRWQELTKNIQKHCEALS